MFLTPRLGYGILLAAILKRLLFSDEDLRESLALGDSHREEATYPQSEMLEFNSSSEVIEQPSATVMGE